MPEQMRVNSLLDACPLCCDPEKFPYSALIDPDLGVGPEWSNFTKYFAQNFEKLKLKKLISTSYAVESKIYKEGYQASIFEERSPKFDKKKTRTKGKIFTLIKDKTGDKKVDINDLDWQKRGRINGTNRHRTYICIT